MSFQQEFENLILKNVDYNLKLSIFSLLFFLQPQKPKMMYNQMNHPMSGGPGMGHHPMGGGGPQQGPYRSPGPDFRPGQFGQMIPGQGQHMGYQGGQNYPQDFVGMGGMGNMMPPGQGGMGMSPNQNPAMGGMRPQGINPIPRPNFGQGMSMGMKQHMLSRSLSVPQQMTPGMDQEAAYGQTFQQPQLQRANSMGMPPSMGGMAVGPMGGGSGQMGGATGPNAGKPGGVRWNNGQMNPNQSSPAAQGMGPGGMGMSQGMAGGNMNPAMNQGMGQGGMGQSGMGPDMFNPGMQPMASSASMELTNSSRNRRTPVNSMTSSQVRRAFLSIRDFLSGEKVHYINHICLFPT